MNDSPAHPMAPFFLQIPLFAELNAGELNDILRGIKPVILESGGLLFFEGDPGDSLYVIQSGAVEVWVKMNNGEQTQVAMLEDQAVLGEMALIDGAPRNATVRAAKKTSLLRLDIEEFNYLRRNFRPAAYKLIRAISLVVCSRIRETNEQINNLYALHDKRSESGTSSKSTASPTLLEKIFSWRKS
jgi:CRP-like cAMP-binding protein